MQVESAIIMYLEKIAIGINVYFPLMGGTILHLAILKKKNGLDASIFGILVLAVICALTGILFRYLAVAYYAVYSLEVQDEVLDFLQFFGGLLGYGGLMWMGSKVEELWGTGIEMGRYGVKAYFNNKNNSQNKRERYESRNNRSNRGRPENSEADYDEPYE